MAERATLSPSSSRRHREYSTMPEAPIVPIAAALAKLHPDSALRNPIAAIIDITATMATATATYRPMPPSRPPIDHRLAVIEVEHAI